jgi:putative addiction module component (TIGR02574 family)
MLTNASAILDAALRLPNHERAVLASRLLESLEPVFADAEIEAAWAAEIKRRIDDLNSGKEKAIPWEEARRMIFEDEDASDAD